MANYIDPLIYAGKSEKAALINQELSRLDLLPIDNGEEREFTVEYFNDLMIQSATQDFEFKLSPLGSNNTILAFKNLNQLDGVQSYSYSDDLSFDINDIQQTEDGQVLVNSDGYLARNGDAIYQEESVTLPSGPVTVVTYSNGAFQSQVRDSSGLSGEVVPIRVPSQNGFVEGYIQSTELPSHYQVVVNFPGSETSVERVAIDVTNLSHYGLDDVIDMKPIRNEQYDDQGEKVLVFQETQGLFFSSDQFSYRPIFSVDGEIESYVQFNHVPNGFVPVLGRHTQVIGYYSDRNHQMRDVVAKTSLGWDMFIGSRKSQAKLIKNKINQEKEEKVEAERDRLKEEARAVLSAKKDRQQLERKRVRKK
ncbi:hypothetical protein DID77_00040 [Candidatus Marinamargulisbacteria bacterium SCGC AG-439-L15]|nr:hypothetical protein DID77_00040 [Candidatus Marinamargulisbacteria bacterium SCGC AG-439-L15]